MPSDRIKNILILLISFSVALLVAELVTRSLFPMKVYDYRNTSSKYLFFDCDNDIAWVGKKKISNTFERKYFSVPVKHDRYGQRNDIPPIAKGKKNIWILGDSFVWGWGVENKETLQASLNRHLPGKNFYALAAPGYGTVHQQLLLERFLEKGLGKPDKVVIVMINNDFTDNVEGVYANTRRKNNQLTMPKYRLVDGDVEIVPKKKDCDQFTEGLDKKQYNPENLKGLMERSHFYNLLSAVIYNYLMSSLGVSENRDPKPEQVQIMAKALLNINNLMADKGIDFQVYYLDFGHDNGFYLLQKELEKFAGNSVTQQVMSESAEENINTSSQPHKGHELLPQDFIVRVDGAEFYDDPANVIPFDGHLTGKGHKKLAGILSVYFE